MPPPHHRPVAHAAAGLSILAVLAACGTPPELRPPEGVPVPSPSSSRTGPPAPSGAPGTPYPSAPFLPGTAAPSATGFPESFAVSCGGKPTGGQVIRVVRRDAGLLSAGAKVSVDTGPLCSGTWQYTVLSVPGRGLLAVVTRGDPRALKLVTAGTDVCSVPVRVEAPPGIRIAATCA